MKKITGIILGLMLVHLAAFSQDKDYIQNPTLGVHFFFNDFQTASNIRNSSLSSTFRDKQFGKLKDMSPGLAINYMQGLNNNFDFSTSLAASSVTYPIEHRPELNDDGFLFELDASIRGKMFSNKYWFIPYVQAGVGVSKFKGYYGAFIPVGLGIQINFFNEAYFLINSQYRVPVTQTANYHFFHSIGLAGNIGTRKPK